MTPTNFMPIIPFPMITILIKGLALTYCKKSAANGWEWEVLFYRDDTDQHDLTVALNYDTPIPIVKGRDIRIVVEAARIKNKQEKFANPEFSRNLEKDDPRDFQWILDFSGNVLHNKPVSTKSIKANSNYLVIPKATFYTGCLDKHPYIKNRITQFGEPGQTNSTEILGYIGDAVAAYILTEEGTEMALEISDSTNPANNRSYPLKAGSYLTFDNDCNQLQSDFHHYYEIIDAGEERFELIAPKKEEPGGQRPITGEQYACVGTTVGDLLNASGSLEDS